MLPHQSQLWQVAAVDESLDRGALVRGRHNWPLPSSAVIAADFQPWWLQARMHFVQGSCACCIALHTALVLISRRRGFVHL
jgi:hypothetical protein